MSTRPWPALLIIAPMTSILGLFVAAVITYMVPPKYESFAVIEIYDISSPMHLPTKIDVLMQMKVDAAILGQSGSGSVLGLNDLILHDAPFIAGHPISPNVRLNLALGAISGLLLGFFMAIIILMIRRHSASAP